MGPAAPLSRIRGRVEHGRPAGVVLPAGVLEGAVARVRQLARQPLLSGRPLGEPFMLQRQARVGELALQFGGFLLQIGEALATRSAVSGA